MKNTKRNTALPIGRFIDPLTDFGFKRIFGSRPNKDLLIAFLNALFKGRKVIKDIVYNPQENNGPAEHYRKTIFDLICTGEDGEILLLKYRELIKSSLPTGLFSTLRANYTSRDQKVKRTGILS
jgi:hypothetical protein